MDRTLVAIIIQECGKAVSALLKNRPPKKVIPTYELPPVTEESTLKEGTAESIEAGCVPCAIGHLGTCTGLLNEGMRFARKDGIDSSEVIDRVNMCLDELNTMERIDLRPEMIAQLPPWQKELAERALSESRTMRHDLEGMTTVEALERVAASTQSTRQEIGRTWFKERLARVTPVEKEKMVQKVLTKLKEEEPG